MDNSLLNNYLSTSNRSNNKKNIFFTKLLISIMLLLLSLIYVKNDDNNLAYFKKYVFEDTFDFSYFRNTYNSLKNNNEVVPVISNVKYINKGSYLDGIKVDVRDNLVETFASGIVVFVGKKDGYNNTVIIQGSDGYDIWYGNLEDINVQIYDYINKNTIIGETNNLYLKALKDGKVIKTDEYLGV